MTQTHIYGIQVNDLKTGRKNVRWYPGATRAWVNGYLFGLQTHRPELMAVLVEKGGR